MKLEQYAKTYIELHHKLNDLDYAGDINAEYQAFWELYRQELDATSMFLGADDKLQFSLHDAWVRNFSAKRCADGYRTVFNVDAFVYNNEKMEIGKQKQEIRIFTPNKLRAITSCQILDFVLDNRTATLVIIHLDRNWNMQYVTCTWSACSRNIVGELQEYA